MELLNRTDRAGYSDAHIRFKNSNVIDRCLWLPDETDLIIFGQRQLQGVYRWHHNDDQAEMGSLVKIDVERGTAQFVDDERFDGFNLFWKRPFKLATFSYSKQEAVNHLLG
jgi:hypothetical protein